MIHIPLLIIIFLQAYQIIMIRDLIVVKRAQGIQGSMDVQKKALSKLGDLRVRSYTDEELWELERKESNYEEV